MLNANNKVISNLSFFQKLFGLTFNVRDSWSNVIWPHPSILKHVKVLRIHKIQNHLFDFFHFFSRLEKYRIFSLNSSSCYKVWIQGVNPFTLGISHPKTKREGNTQMLPHPTYYTTKIYIFPHKIHLNGAQFSSRKRLPNNTKDTHKVFIS